MTAKEACMIINNTMPYFKILSCYEYNTIFVFQIVNKKAKNVDTSKLLNNTVSVNKMTKEVKSFRPFDISINEYKNGKKVILN